MKRLSEHLVRACLVAVLMAVGTGTLAEPANVAGTSPWGAEDEIGTLNMMTENSRFDVLKQVDTGKVYDLAVDLFVGMPDCCSAAFGDPTYQMWMTHTPARGRDELLSHSSEAISMNTHTGTHLDALSHFGLHGEIWNGVAANDALGVRGWTRSGADKYPPIVARGVMIDVAQSKDMEHLPPSYSITVEDLKQALARQETTLSPGDVVLVRTGQMILWPDKTKLSLFQQSGLSLEAAQWLAEEQQAMLLGADNFGLESFPSGNSENFAPVHSYLLAEKGVSFMELVWLEELSEDEVYEFLFMATPLKLRGATGSPIRPVAIPIRRDG
ncbi:cyclase [Maritimibacter sp. 55A14]|uniref:cyclase family protein n=1 Tax=Maritimibacter sp. 55A14 TaxID=2174844 RepID=UPI000D611A3E|nr:cyclase family protein [Maritimibacter sp. 55A14]PWE29900.1 cyclase [Maritimibacter sp. 55A14]